MDKDYEKCLNCKHCYDDDEGLYCELEECKYEFGSKKVFDCVWDFILFCAFMSLLALGLSMIIDILNIKSIHFGIGFIAFAIMYIIYKLTQWWRRKYHNQTSR